jgi:IclR family transcriptional regulator, acetate operon repressor
MTNLQRNEIVDDEVRPMPASEAGGVQSVARALRILDILSEHGREMALSEVAGHAGLNVSTCHHLISTLAASGYVARMPGQRSYILGPKILVLGGACLRQVNLPRLAERHLDAISEATSEAVQLVVMHGTDLVGILRREARHALRVDVGIGGKFNAAHAAASGKAILAWLPETQVDRILAEKGMTAFTPKTITTRKALNEELRLVRRTGLAYDRQEFQPGVACIAAAVRDHAGAVAGAISVSVPVLRGTPELIERMRNTVRDAARALSVELGGPAAPRPGLNHSHATNPAKGEPHAATGKRKNLAKISHSRADAGLGAG